MIKMTNRIQTEFGSAKIQNDGYYKITSGKEGNNKKHLHKLIWEKYYGKVPEGYVVHHIDHNKLNNDIMNLELMSLPEHISHHKKGINHKGRNNPSFNPCIKIYKQKNQKVCKQRTKSARSNTP